MRRAKAARRQRRPCSASCCWTSMGSSAMRWKRCPGSGSPHTRGMQWRSTWSGVAMSSAGVRRPITNWPSSGIATRPSRVWFGVYHWANLLATGRGTAPDRAHALALNRQAADLGHAKSMNLVGRHHEEGWEVERDPTAAPAWCRGSAHAGDFRGRPVTPRFSPRAVASMRRWNGCNVHSKPEARHSSPVSATSWPLRPMPPCARSGCACTSPATPGTR